MLPYRVNWTLQSVSRPKSPLFISPLLCQQNFSPFLLFVFNRLRTLSFSVSRNSFACHSCENCWVYTNNSHSETRSLPSRDEKPLSASALESAFTNCDARNSFRMRIYKNCRVSLVFLIKVLKSYLKIRSRRCLFVHSLPLYFLASLLRPSHATIPRPA